MFALLMAARAFRLGFSYQVMRDLANRPEPPLKHYTLIATKYVKPEDR